LLKGFVEAIGFKERSKKRKEDFTRERKMGFKKLVYFMLSMIKESTQNALERFFEKNGEETFMTQQAFSLARQKIKWEAFQEMFDFTVTAYYNINEIVRWNGYRVSAVDGSKLALPDDKPLLTYFGGNGANKESPVAQGSMLYDLLNGVVMHALIDPTKTGEQTQARAHIKRLEGLESFEGGKELVIFDRGYPSKELIQELMDKKIDYLMRVRTKFSTVIDALDLGDHRIELEYGKKRIPVRVIKLELDSKETETLITSLTDTKYGVEDFKQLYFKRWPIETKYDVIKKKLEIENFSGKLVDNIRQDFYATMTLANIAADLYREAQAEVEIEQEGKENKYQYQVNVNHEIGVLKDRLVKTLIEDDDKKRSAMFDEILNLLKKRLIPIRPNRSLPRTPFPRRVKFHHNHKSNC
jgi:hypothetical protein